MPISFPLDRSRTKKRKPSAIPLGHRNRPPEGRESEDVACVMLGSGFDQLGLNALGVYLITISKFVHEPIKLMAEDMENA